MGQNSGRSDALWLLIALIWDCTKLAAIKHETGPLTGAGYPHCKNWWNDTGIGLRERLKQTVKPELWVKIKQWTGWSSAKEAEEAVLEQYYRAAIKNDTVTLEKLTDFSMFDKNIMSHHMQEMYKLQRLLSEMDELVTKNGELKKVKITESKENNDGTVRVWLITAELSFANGREILRKDMMSKRANEWKVFMLNEQ